MKLIYMRMHQSIQSTYAVWYLLRIHIFLVLIHDLRFSKHDDSMWRDIDTTAVNLLSPPGVTASAQIHNLRSSALEVRNLHYSHLV